MKTFEDTYKRRNINQFIWESLFLLGVSFSALVLVILILSILNRSFGYVVCKSKIPVEKIEKYVSKKIEKFEKSDYEKSITHFIKKRKMPYYLRSREKMNIKDLELYLKKNIVNTKILKTYTLAESLFDKKQIFLKTKNKKNTYIEFRSWINYKFLVSNQSSNPLFYGLKTAILGSLYIVFLTIIIAFPLGLGTAIYLEYYSKKKSIFSKLIQINIYNLSGIPSIVYGLFGLMFFVTVLKSFTSGSMFGLKEFGSSSRTILSASLTMALLVLPLIIITSQQALKSVPKQIIDASYGLGASKYQTIFSHILPNCFHKILTGIIFSISRVLGESSPLIVVGASAFITSEPKGIFSGFSVIPIQIYQLVSRPQKEYSFLSSSSIIVLLIMLFLLNISAIIMRSKLEKKINF